MTYLTASRGLDFDRSFKPFPSKIHQGVSTLQAILRLAMAPQWVLGSLLGLLLSMGSPSLWAQSDPVAAASSTQLTPRPKVVDSKSTSSTKPAPWQELQADQRLALQPLAKIWNSLSTGQQLKWLTLAANFKKLTPTDQVKLQSRMHEWASLGMRERDQARIGFSETRQLSDEQKKAKWEAYQALSLQEKQALAQQNPPKVGLAAKATAPVPADKKVNMPKAASPAASSTASVPLVGVLEKRKPRLAAVPEKVSPNTLLPTDKH